MPLFHGFIAGGLYHGDGSRVIEVDVSVSASAAHVATAALTATPRAAAVAVAAPAVHQAVAGIAVTVANPPAGQVTATIAALGVHAATAAAAVQVRSGVSVQISALAAHVATAAASVQVADSSLAYAPQPETASSWSYQQTATLWRLTGRADWTGARTFAAPVLFLCDYMRDQKMAVSDRGDEFVSKLTLFTSLPGVKQGDMVLIGSSGNADPVATDAEEVQAVVTYADTFNAGGPEDFKILA
jgi:hypothetical protein